MLSSKLEIISQRHVVISERTGVWAGLKIRRNCLQPKWVSDTRSKIYASLLKQTIIYNVLCLLRSYCGICWVLMNMHIQVVYVTWTNIHLFSALKLWQSSQHLRILGGTKSSTALHIFQFLKQHLMLHFIFAKLIKLEASSLLSQWYGSIFYIRIQLSVCFSLRALDPRLFLFSSFHCQIIYFKYLNSTFKTS